MRFNSTLFLPLEEHIIDVTSLDDKSGFFLPLFLACNYIVKAIIMNFLKDRDVGIIHFIYQI